MVAIAYSVLADHHLAEDAVQEAYAKALVKLPNLRKPAGFASWLARICRNTALDMTRVNSRQTTTDDFSHVPAVEQHENEYAGAVRQAIAALPASAREMIVLRYYDKMSHRQMAAVLGTSKAAVTSKLQRIKQKLANILEKSVIKEGQL